MPLKCKQRAICRTEESNLAVMLKDYCNQEESVCAAKFKMHSAYAHSNYLGSMQLLLATAM